MKTTSAALLASRISAQAPRPSASDDSSAVIRAIVAEQLMPRVRKPGARVALVNESLALCVPGMRRPCVSEDVLQHARLDAARGEWSTALADRLRTANATPHTIPDVHSDTLIERSRAEIMATANTENVEIAGMTMPVFDGDQALVLVQYAQVWVWLVRVTFKDGAWHVTYADAWGAS